MKTACCGRCTNQVTGEMEDGSICPHHGAQHTAAQSIMTPGVRSLLKLLRKGPMRRKYLMRTQEFQGWDPESVQYVINEVNGMGLLSESGDTLRLRTASITSRVAIRYLSWGDRDEH